MTADTSRALRMTRRFEDRRPRGRQVGHHRPAQGHRLPGGGEYLEIDRPRRLVFTFSMPQFSPNSDRITVEIAPDGDGCLLTFTQEGADIAEELRQLPPGAKVGSEQGWAEMFGRLAAALA